ncbi:hypothetical protein GCM10023170_055740 [Phytohabitans houttuyneae]
MAAGGGWAAALGVGAESPDTRGTLRGGRALTLSNEGCDRINAATRRNAPAQQRGGEQSVGIGRPGRRLVARRPGGRGGKVRRGAPDGADLAGPDGDLHAAITQRIVAQRDGRPY